MIEPCTGEPCERMMELCGSKATPNSREGTLIFVQRYQPYLIQRLTLSWPFFPRDALLIICNYFYDQRDS